MYRIYLQREEIFVDKEGSITLQQFLDVIKEDNELSYTKSIEYISPFGEKIVKSGLDYILWDKNGLKIYFEFKNGVISGIYCKEVLEKMSIWSGKLNGFISGEIGEEY